MTPEHAGGDLSALREALKPFADVADMFDDSDDDHHEVWMDIGPIGVPRSAFRLEHYRRARALLTALEQQP